MSPLFTEDDVGKPVENAAGEEIGIVAEIEGETAYVDPNIDPDVADSSKAALDWGRESAETVPLADEAVAELTDDAVRLEAAFPDESITTGGRDEDETDGASERPDIGSFSESSSSSSPEPDADVPGSDVAAVNRGTGAGEVDESSLGPDEAADAAGREGTEPPEEIDAVEEDASRELEVDPTELTDEPEAEIEPGEDVGDRTDVGTEPRLRDDDREPSGPTTEDAGPIETEIDAETERNTDVREREGGRESERERQSEGDDGDDER